MLIRTNIGLLIPKLQSVFFLALFSPQLPLQISKIPLICCSQSCQLIPSGLIYATMRQLGTVTTTQTWGKSYGLFLIDQMKWGAPFLLRYNLVNFKISFTYTDDSHLALILASQLAHFTLWNSSSMWKHPEIMWPVLVSDTEHRS